MRRAAIACAAMLGTGCPSVGAFECFTSADCDLGGDAGECISGGCAYDDPTCDSGMKWSPNAPTDPGECVGVDSSGTTSTTTAASTSSGPEPSSSTITTITTEPESTSTGPTATCGSQMAVDIDTALLSTTVVLEDYPLLLEITAADLVDEDPDTIFFTAEDGTPLPHERESFDAASGTLLTWLRLPSWTLGEPLHVVLAWGDASSVPDLSAANVWSPSYLAVWHFSDVLDDSDGEVIRNAIAGNGHGFAFGGIGPDQSTEGAIGSAILFDGSDDYVEVSAPFVGTLQSFTVSYWSRWDGGLEQGGYFGRLNGEHLYPRCWRIDGAGAPYCQLHSVDTTVGVGGDVRDVAAGNMVHMALTWDGTTAISYYAGLEDRTNDDYPGKMPLGGRNPAMIGREFEFGTFNGIIDEFRVSDRALSAEWIGADYRTQSNPSNAVLEIGAAEPRPCESLVTEYR